MNQEKEPARVTKNSSLNGLVSHLRWNAAFPSMVDSLEFSLRSLLADLPSIGAIRCTSDCPESRSGSVKIQVSFFCTNKRMNINILGIEKGREREYKGK